MNSFGIMSLSLDHETHYVEQIAKYGKDHSFQVFHFIPSSFNPITERTKGRAYNAESNKWINSEFPIPKFLYDRCFYQEDSHSKQCKNITSWLKQKKDVTFIGNGLPNKLNLYELLKNSKLAPYIPKTNALSSAEDLLVSLQETNPILIKPINGSQGNGIYLLNKESNSITVKTDKKEKQVIHTFTDLDVFCHWLNRLLKKTTYLSQPYLPLYNHQQQPFDIRSFLQKKPSGNWDIIGKGIRLGSPNRIISNLSAGAEVMTFRKWLQESPFQMKKFIETEVNDILSEIPVLLEEEFPTLFELGIDIGITQNGSLWILDINSKPGRQVIIRAYPHLEDSLYRAPLLYAAKLAESQRSLDNEKSLPS